MLMPDNMMSIANNSVVKRTYSVFDPGYVGANWSLSNGNRTATKSAAGYTALWFDQSKSSGKWSFEVLASYGGGGSDNFMHGIGSTRTLTTFVGGFTNSIGWASAGNRWINNSSTANFWANYTTSSNVYFLFAIDCDNRLLYCIDPAKTALKSSTTALGGSGAMYFGVSGTMTTARTFTINTGQSAFQSANETMLANLEASLGVTFKRGIYTEP